MSGWFVLIFEFFKVGLFSIGGGLATIPFLADMGRRLGWFTYSDLMNMLAVSESTPGPIGINMATYVGYTIQGVPGAVIGTLAEVAPSIIIIYIVSAFLEKFRNNKYVDWAFYGLRAASTGLIAAALLEIFAEVALIETETGISGMHTKAIILMPVIWYFSNRCKLTKNLHPICFILAAAVVGIVFSFSE